MKRHYPVEAGMREPGLEWRDRPMSDSQTIFCERHGMAYDPQWSRGTANNMIDRFVVQVGVVGVGDGCGRLLVEERRAWGGAGRC